MSLTIREQSNSIISHNLIITGDLSVHGTTTTVNFAQVENAKYKDAALEETINNLLEKINSLEEKVALLESKSEEMYYAPGMPGYHQAKQSFDEMAKGL